MAESRDDLLLVGRVARAHGNRGQVIVNPETDFAEIRFKVGQVLLVGSGDRLQPRRVEEVRFHQGRPIIALEGIGTMNQAEALAGEHLWLPAATIEPLPADTYYRHDLVGCEVHDVQGAAIGRVIDVQGTLERSHLVVESRDGEVLIPLNAGICVRVEPSAGKIVVDPPEGLLELNRRER